MLTKLIIPVPDTESGKFEFNGKLSREDFENMSYNQYLSTNNDMNRFTYNISHGISNVNKRMTDYAEGQEDDSPDLLYKFCEAEVFIQNAKKKEIDKEFLLNHIEKGDMFILILNINPNSLDGDAESEIRFWIDDSLGVHRDDELDDKTKLKILPTRWFFLDIDGQRAVIDNCKILQDYSSKKWPFNFAIIVEKITFEK